MDHEVSPPKERKTTIGQDAKIARTGERDLEVRPQTPLSQLQSAIGNRAVGRIMRQTSHQRGVQSLRGSLSQLQRQIGNRHIGQVLRQIARAERCACDNASADHSGARMDAIERSIAQARGAGQTMDRGTRGGMEAAFGADFSDVRVHTDARAQALSESLSARAFTTGRDVFFAQGEYDPGSSGGRELLAHELTHVVQQSGGRVQRKMTVSQPGDPHEVEADQMARAVIQFENSNIANKRPRSAEDAGENWGAAQPASTGLQRQTEINRPDEDERKKHLAGSLEHRHGSEEKTNDHQPPAHAAPVVASPIAVPAQPHKAPVDEDKKKDDKLLQAKARLQPSATRGGDRTQETVFRTPETQALPKWGTAIFNKSSMTLNPFARLIVDGKVVRDDWAITGGTPAVFTVPACAKSGEVQIIVGGYWFQNNQYINEKGEGTATSRSAFDVNEKGEIHFKLATSEPPVRGRVAQMSIAGTAADNPPAGGTLSAQVGIFAGDQIGIQQTTPAGPWGLPTVAASTSISTAYNFSRTFQAHVTMEKKVGKPVTRVQPVYFKVGKHQVLGSKDPQQFANIPQINDFLKNLPKDVRKELEDGMGERKAQIQVVAQASVTTPPKPGAGFNVELTEKRRDAVVRLLQNYLGGGAKIKAKAVGELDAVDPGESGLERVATITVSWEDDPCATPAPKAP